MDPDLILTVGIPTYNRKNTVLDTVRKLVDTSAFGRLFKVLLIDNGSQDGTLDALETTFEQSKSLQFLGNGTNLGASRNFLKLIEKTETNYLLVLSDEDALVEENLIAFSAWLSDCSPNFVSPIAQSELGGWPIRGLSTLTRVLPWQVTPATFYISGLTFRVDHFRSLASKLWDQVSSNSFIFYYPQTALVAESVLREGSDRLFFHPLPITYQRVELEPGQRVFSSKESIQSQHEDLCRFVEAISGRNLEATNALLKRANLEFKAGLWVSSRQGFSNWCAWMLLQVVNLWQRRGIFLNTSRLMKRVTRRRNRV